MAKPNSAFMISGRERLSLGLHSVREAIKVRPHAIKRLGLREDYLRAPQIKEIADLATENNVEIRPLSAKELDNIGSGHQGAAAVITESPKFNLNALKKLDKCIVVACDGLEDPMNLGAILRSAWLLGAAGILLPQDRSVTVTTATTKVASGGAEHVPVEVVSNLPRELELMREAGFWIFGLAEKGTGLPWNFKLPEKIVWVIGSESSGLRITVERACDELVKLPQVPGGSSYNAAVAATMALYESVRQHGIPPKS
jgi:23S rRNA (guanosine2251-2'-O)-methyltransferase